MPAPDKIFKLNESKIILAHFERFSSIMNYLSTESDKVILIDLSEYKYIHPSFAVLIASMIYVGKENGNEVHMRVDSKAAEFLSNAGILTHFKIQTPLQIPWMSRQYKRESNFLKIMNMSSFEKVLDRLSERMPENLSAKIQSDIVTCLHEASYNAFQHSGKECFFCSTYGDNDEIICSIYDAGCGIPAKVLKFTNKDWPHEKCIRWALESGNTTVIPTEDSYPRGVGLATLKGIVDSQNGYSMILASGDTLYRFYRYKYNTKSVFDDLKTPLLGTLFTIIINNAKSDS